MPERFTINGKKFSRNAILVEKISLLYELRNRKFFALFRISNLRFFDLKINT